MAGNKRAAKGGKKVARNGAKKFKRKSGEKAKAPVVSLICSAAVRHRPIVYDDALSCVAKLTTNDRQHGAEDSLKMLGVSFDSRLGFHRHATGVIQQCAGPLAGRWRYYPASARM